MQASFRRLLKLIHFEIPLPRATPPHRRFICTSLYAYLVVSLHCILILQNFCIYLILFGRKFGRASRSQSANPLLLVHLLKPPNFCETPYERTSFQRPVQCYSLKQTDYLVFGGCPNCLNASPTFMS